MSEGMLRFAELPAEAQAAVRVFCLEISDDQPGIEAGKTELQEHVDQFRFTLETISMEAAIARYMKTETTFPSFERYHRWYLKTEPVPSHTTRWPVIESPFADEWLEDGWHRFHCYVEAGDTAIQVLKFHPLEVMTPGQRLAKGDHYAEKSGREL